MARMRIAYSAPFWPPERYPNGIVSALGVLAPALRDAGCDVRIVANAGETHDGEADVVFINGGEPDPWMTRAAGAVRRRLLPSSLYFQDYPNSIARAVLADPRLRSADLFEIEESFGWGGALRARLPMPVVVALHGPWFLTGVGDGRSLTPFDRERIRREGRGVAAADGVSAKSRFVLEAVRRYYNLSLPDAVVIPNAIAPPPAEHRWRLSAADPDEILFVGRFDRLKGADILLRAFAILAAKRPALRLTFVGPIDRPIDVEGKRYTHRTYVDAVMPPDAAARVAFLGRLAPSDIGPLRGRAFLTIVSSRTEVLPYVMLEALAYGSPTVATDVGGVPEIAVNDVEALLAPPEDPGALAAAMERLLDHPDRAAALGEAGRQRVSSEFAPERIARLTIEYHQTVVARRGVRQSRRSG